MPRRKNEYLSDGGSDSDASNSSGSEEGFNSQEDEDSRAERRRFEHSGRKRRKVGSGKAAAWEGIFGEDGERRGGGRGLGARKGPNGAASGSRTDWTKAPSFVPKTNGAPEPEVEPTKEESEGDEDDDDDEEEEEDDSEDDDTPRPASPRVRETDYDDEPPARSGLGGLGSRPAMAAMGKMTAERQSEPAEKPRGNGRGGIGSSKRGGKGGIGSTSRTTESEEASRPPLSASNSQRGGLGSAKDASHHIEDFSEDVQASSARAAPTAFGRKVVDHETEAGPSDYARSQQSFRGRVDTPPALGAKKVDLTAQEKAHFNKIDKHYGIAAKMLSNMGWSAGEGLGKDRSGRAVPVEVGRVMRGQGIRAGTRTEDSKREARRRGEKISDEEEDQPRRGRRGQGRGHGPKAEGEDIAQSWKKQRKVKVKVEHKTYEQLLAEAGDAAPAGNGLIIDARGGEMKEVQNLSALSLNSWTPSSDATQLPELRHNLRLVVDEAKMDVDALAREGRAVGEKRRWALREEQLARKRIDDTTRRIARLEKLQESISAITKIAAEEASKADPSLQPLSESFAALLEAAGSEYKSMGMDEVIVGAIASVMRRPFAEWQPFDLSSDALLSSLKQWKKAYNLPTTSDDQALIVNGHDAPRHLNGVERVMTPWESLLWNIWLPKVRSAINNDWEPRHPEKAVHLLESWDPLLPHFVRDNILDQLILPKVRTSIDEWDSRRSKAGKTRSLAAIVFPWLPMLGARMEEVLELAKRRIRHVMRKWVVGEGVPSELERWKKDIYSSKEWDELMLRNVVPKLGVCLRDDFSINPRQQDMVPLEEWVLPWHKLIRGSTFCQLLEVNFFPKFLDTLYIWLIQPNRNGDEIASWFLWWKGRFPELVLEMKGIQYGFRSALQLMDQASQLGAETGSKLAKPVFTPLPPSKSSSKVRPKPSSPAPQPTNPLAETEITFRYLAEDYATQNDLVFVPLGKSHASTGKPLFRVGKNVTGKGGISVYVGENAVFAQGEDGSYKAISLDDMVRRASA